MNAPQLSAFIAHRYGLTSAGRFAVEPFTPAHPLLPEVVHLEEAATASMRLRGAAQVLTTGGKVFTGLRATPFEGWHTGDTSTRQSRRKARHLVLAKIDANGSGLALVVFPSYYPRLPVERDRFVARFVAECRKHEENGNEKSGT